MLERLQSAIDALTSQRVQVAETGLVLQHCWLVEVKPGGTARTDAKYWQVRSRQPIFAGKTLKHLKSDEVEAYKAAIERGRQLKQIDRQIAKLQQRLAQLTSTADLMSSSSESLSSQYKPHCQIPMLPNGDFQHLRKKQSLSSVKFTNLAEQERLVKEVLADSQALRASLRQRVALGKQIGARYIDLRRGHPDIWQEDI